jgi:hypothetical protein
MLALFDANEKVGLDVEVFQPRTFRAGEATTHALQRYWQISRGLLLRPGRRLIGRRLSR